MSEFLLEHLIPGKAFDTFNEEDIYGNANKHPIIFKSVKNMNESQWTINGLKILRTTQVNDKLSAIYLDGFLGDRKGAFSKRNIQEHNRYRRTHIQIQMTNFYRILFLIIGTIFGSIIQDT